MASSPLLSIRNAGISFAQRVLFEDLNLNLFPKDRVCLIGKNGVGKTTLMNAIYGSIQLDHGERWIMPGTVIGYLSQNESLIPELKVIDYIASELKAVDEHKSYLADIVCDHLEIDKNALMKNLSGGQLRRAHLAKALVLEPDILLLDEPTNHLDLHIIEWLENYLKNYSGSLFIISHDRKFLENVSNKVFWLRSGNIKINPHGYKNFEEWSNQIIEQEERELINLQKKVELESQWLQTGVTARRKRNIGRLHHLQELRAKLKSQKRLVSGNKNNIKIEEAELDDDSPHLFVTINNISKSFPAPTLSDPNHVKNIINKFSLKILRGEKIGIIGKNGSGKSTFLKMIIGDLKPDSGKIKTALDLKISYFDQHRIGIKPGLTIQNVLCPSGGDYVTLANGKVRHICGYLQDFLFDPKETKTMASTLSGGQQNRLLLAKTLANPGNFLILDEPTNDLDMDSLDMLQNFLDEYKGNLLVVSHDRSFLDNVVTSILAFEDDGKITYHLGGYSDYLDYKQRHGKNNFPVKLPEKEITVNENKNSLPINSAEKPKKLSYKYAHELEKLPGKIEKLEQKIADLTLELSETEERSNANLAHISMEIAKLQNELDVLEERWIELEEMAAGK